MDNFHALADYLRQRFPINRKLVIRRCAMNDHGGTSINSSENRITICICASDPAQTQLDTLTHEYAHALEYDRWGNHSDRWGKLYADCYKTWVEWDAS